MNSSELVAAGLLGTNYLNARYNILDDLALIRHVLKISIPYVYECLKGRASFWYHFERCVKRYGDNVAIRFPRQKSGVSLGDLTPDRSGHKPYVELFQLESYTYKEMYDIVLRLSYILKTEYGVTSDQTIAIDCTNKPLFIFLWFALWNIGALPAFVNYNTKSKPLVHCLQVANVSQVFIDPEAAGPIRETEPEIRSTLPDVKLHYLNEFELLKILGDAKAPTYRAPDNTRRPNDTDYSASCLIYTSGTTGLPKPAIISWRKSYVAGSLFSHVMKIHKKSNVFTAMPLYHSTAAMLGVLPSLSSGGCISISSKFSARTFWSQAKLVEASHIQYVGEVCRYLLHAPYHPDENSHGVKIAVGNGLRKDIWKTFKDRFSIDGVGEFYASTESPIATTSLQFGDYGVGACRKYGSLVSFILSFQQNLVRMDPEDPGEIYRNAQGLCEIPATDEPGELLMRIVQPKNIESTFQGYYNNKKANSSKIIYDVYKPGDCWFRSGDLLKMDQHGLLYFIDRLGDTFRWKSENVSATEVENELTSCQSIKQTVVVGVKVPNHEGRAGFAVVEPIEELENFEKLLEELADIGSKNLPKYAVPMFVKIASIQNTDNHKVPKNQFKNQKLPNGDDGKDVIYWLKDGKYKKLTEPDWHTIVSGKARL